MKIHEDPFSVNVKGLYNADVSLSSNGGVAFKWKLCSHWLKACDGIWHSRQAVAIAHFHFPHDDVIKWKHFPRYWLFVRGIHRSPVNSTHKGQWRGALMFSLICVWINDWVNNGEAGDLRRYRIHYDVTVMGEMILVISTLRARRNTFVRTKCVNVSVKCL